ncbi:MAG: DUF4313 domain-containing protein [Bacilli bacterium]|nr:DUF4313 domain-containing protein [Bacilli bacterium]
MKKVLYENNDRKYYLCVASYQNNGRLYLGVVNEEDEICGDITINLTDEELDKDEIFLSDDLVLDDIKELQDKNIIGNVLYTTQYNFGNYKAVSVDFDILREYDNAGVEEFEINYNKFHPEEMER